jgi:hypothetical protein
MRKYQFILSAISLLLLAACTGSTVKQSEGNQNSNAADSAVGNSNAANTIYRDSSDLINATEPGGGTGNPSSKSDTSNK